jgi:hypothetical protein
VKKESWNGDVRVNRSFLKDLLWWRTVLEKNKSHSLVVLPQEAELWTDASPSGWGAHAVWLDQNNLRKEMLAYGGWLNDWSSNKRELVAVQRALVFFARTEESRHIRSWLLHSDNTTTVYNINRCASAKSLVNPMRRLMSCLEHLEIFVRAVHVRGIDNSKADSLSRLSRAGDYSLKDNIFKQMINTLEAQITCDLFANRKNRKHPLYCSLSLRDNRSLARDAFLIPWKSLGLPLIHPPIPLLLRALRKIKQEKIRAVVVTPHWLGQPWTNSLRTMIVKGMKLGQSSLTLDLGSEMLRRQDKLPPGEMAAFLVDGSMTRGSRWF